MVEASTIIFFVLIVGGAFGVLTATGALDSCIAMLSKKLANREKWIIPVFMLFFGAAGALMAMSEETLVYIGIFVSLAIALGFDTIVGLLANGYEFYYSFGSGQAALTMPIMAPLADMVGITRQTAVLAYQLGDVLSNLSKRQDHNQYGPVKCFRIFLKILISMYKSLLIFRFYQWF